MGLTISRVVLTLITLSRYWGYLISFQTISFAEDKDRPWAKVTFDVY